MARSMLGTAAVGAPLKEQAYAKGLVYGSSAATWQIEPDPQYSALYQREAGTLLTEDDLLWYRLKPSPGAALDQRPARRRSAPGVGRGLRRRLDG
jgi:endo-1,4-beta-xylanase